MTSFLEKMYDPYIEKNKYMSTLNEGIVNIRRDTRKNVIENHKLAMKQIDIKRIKSEFVLFNHPSKYN